MKLQAYKTKYVHCIFYIHQSIYNKFQIRVTYLLMTILKAEVGVLYKTTGGDLGESNVLMNANKVTSCLIH